MKLNADAMMRLAVRVAFVAGVGAVAGPVAAQEASPTPIPAPAETPSSPDAAAPAAPAEPAAVLPVEAVSAPAAAAPSSEKAINLDRVVVTGTRIKQANLTASSQLTLVGEKEFKASGTVNVESLLNSLPQSFAEFSTADSNGATGTATVNLRNLGSQQTLVLIDGKRLMPGDPLQNAPSADLNFIPAALVERVEVLSGGASAVYGSDAVAGVVNFIMKKDLDGVMFDSQLSSTDRLDGTVVDSTLAFGSNSADGRGNVTGFLSYSYMQGITQDKRKFSKCSLTTNAAGNRQTCAGSPTIAEGRFLSYDRYYSDEFGAEGDASYYSIVDPNGTRALVADDGRTFNFAPFNYLQRPDKRYNLGVFGNYKFSPALDLYASAMLMDDRTPAQVAPSGLFGTRTTVPCNSPLLSDQQKQYLCGDVGLDTGPDSTDVATLAVLKRTVEIGPRISDLRHTQYRLQTGFRGEFGNGFNYDVSAQRGEVIYASGTLNYVNLTNARDGLATAVDANGNAVCASGNPNCVPVDLFQVGALTPDQVNFIKADGFSQANLIEEVLGANITGDLGQYGAVLPWAKNGVSFASGVEYRTEALDYRPDSLVSSGNLGGVGGPSPAVRGAFQVHEAYSELQIPIWEDLPFGKLLQADGAYRWSNYSIANDAQGYKVGLRYQPIEDLTVRYSFQRATRAPSVNELFSPQAFGLAGGSDPCAGANIRAAGAAAPTLEQCMRSGVTEAQYNAAATGGGIADCASGQCNALTGGNLDLRSERSITRQLGIVFTPSFVRGLSMTVDYFDIILNGQIGNQPINAVLNQCVFGGDDVACGLINRGPAGRLSGDTSVGNFVELTNQNVGYFRTKGFDIGGTYRRKLKDMGLPDIGTLTSQFDATYLDLQEVQPNPAARAYDCTGLYGATCGTPIPYYRHKLRMTWDMPSGVGISAAWRYFGGTSLDSATNDPSLTSAAGRANQIDDKIGAKQYLDLSASYKLPIKQKISLRAGISNVGGQNPPTLSSNAPNAISSPPFGNANTFPNVYDSLGRVMFVGLSAEF